MRDEQADGELIDGVVVRSISGFYEVDAPVGRRTAALRSGLRRARGDTMYESRGRVRFRSEALEPVVVGDRVRIRLSLAEGGRDWIEEVLPRERVLQRRAAGERRPVGQTLVANVDQVLLVFAVRDPEPKLGLVDRLLVAAESQDIPPVLVLNKVDLPIDEEVLGGFAELEAVGYPLVAASARTGEGLDGLRAQLAGRTSAVVGPSGVGKSSLLNAVQPGLLLGTGVVSEAIHKGRHTTRYAQLLPLEFGGHVVDTPGMREFGLWAVDPDELERYFPEFRPLLGECRFADCAHVDTAGCAIMQAVEDGEVSERRYRSYTTLREESEGEAILRAGRF